MHVENLEEVGLGDTYHDKNGFSGTVKYLGQRPKVIVSIDVPSGVSVSRPSRAIQKDFTISPSSQLSDWQTIETYGQP